MCLKAVDLRTALLQDHVDVAGLQRLVAGLGVDDRLEVDAAQVRQLTAVRVRASSSWRSS